MINTDFPNNAYVQHFDIRQIDNLGPNVCNTVLSPETEIGPS